MMQVNKKLNRLRTWCAALAVLVCAIAVFSIQPAHATVPMLLNFQGKLTKVSDGTNVADGNYSMQFKIYSALTGGSLLWTETWDGTGSTTQASVTNGTFSVKLGTYVSLSTIDFSSGSLYLSVNFNPGGGYDGEMSPRKQLTSAAFAISANSVYGNGNINITNTGTTTSAAIITYNPSSSSGNSALLVTAGSNTTGPALSVTQNGTGYAALFSGGNVGIGTTAPASLLTLQGSSSTTSLLNIASSSGSSVLYVANNGNVGVGTTTPAAILSLQGTAGSAVQLFDIASSSGTSYLHVMAAGNVGIGTSTPQATLNIQGISGVNPFLVSSSTGSNLMVLNNAGSLTLAGSLTVTSATTTINGISYYWPASQSANSFLMTNGSGVLSWNATSSLFGGTPWLLGGNSLSATGTFGTLSNNDLNFITNSSTRMTILAGGNVGIGNISPADLLDVGSQTAGGNAQIAATRGAEMSPALTTGNWNLGSGWTASGGVLIKDGVGTGVASPSGTFTVVAGTTYEVKITVSSGGSAYTTYSIGGVMGSILKATTTYDDFITAQTSGAIIFNTSNYTSAISISSLSVKALALNTGALTVEGPLTVRSTTSFMNPVGFNTASPTVPIEVMSNYNDAIRVDRNGVPGQYLSINDGLNTGYGGMITNVGADKPLSIINNAATSPINFVVNTSVTSLQLLANGNIYASGNVGIGTANPGQKLTVSSGNNFAVEMATPAAPTIASSTTGGTLTAGPYWFKISAYDGVGTTAGSSEVTATTTGSTGSITLTWSAITGATNYRVYFSTTTAGSEAAYISTTTISSFVFSTSTVYTALGAVPSATTAYINKLTASGNSWLNGGSIGIGTSTPAAMLSLQGTAGSAAQLFDVASSSGTSYLHVRANGNVGIGSSTPIATLSLQGTSGTNALYIASSTGSVLMTIQQNGNVGIGSSTPIATLSLQGTSGTNALYIASSTGSVLMAILQNGNVGIGSGTPVATLSLQGTSGTNPLYIASSTGTGLMVIQQNGNVGIGTTTPQVKLVVQSAGTTISNISNVDALGAGNAQLQLQDSTDNTKRLLFGILTDGAGSSYIQSVQAGSGRTNLLLNPNGGNVGIGNTVPAGLLDVGSAKSGTPSATIGAFISQSGYTFTDNNTASGTTVAGMAFNSLGQQILTATNASTTYTNIYGLYLAGAPKLQATANLATATNSTALYIAAGAVTASTTNAYGLYVNAPTGATNNYAAILQGGYVGIGTTTPTNAKLHLYGSGDYDAVLRLQNVATGGQDAFIVSTNNNWTSTGGNLLGFGVGAPSSSNVKMVLTSSGNVGIGTASPGQKLTVSSGNNFAVEMTTPAAPTIASSTTGGTLTAGPYWFKISAYDGVGTTAGSSEVTATTTGSTGSITLTWSAITGATNYRVYFSTTTAGSEAAYISTTTISSFVFSTSTVYTALGAVPSATTAYINKLTASGNSWVNGGNVGIGTTAAAQKLQVVGTAGANATPLLISTAGTWSSGQGTGIDFQDSIGEVGHIQVAYDGTRTNMSFGGLYNGGYGSVSNQLMIIMGNGNVGIGTTVPASLLTLRGTGTTTSLLNIASSSGSSVLYVANSGNVGIGTTTGSALFSLQGTSGSTNQLFDIASSSGTSYLHVTAAGNVGIGTTSPSQLLTVGNNNQFTVSSAGAATSSSLVITGLTAGTYCVHSVNGLLQSTASDCGAGGGGSGGGWATTTPNIIYNSFGALVGINSSTPTANLTVEGISGSTTPIFVVASSTNSQYLTVLANGNVGIGSSSPVATLSVAGITPSAGDAGPVFTVIGGTGASGLVASNGGPITLLTGAGGAGIGAGTSSIGGNGGALTLQGGNAGSGGVGNLNTAGGVGGSAGIVTILSGNGGIGGNGNGLAGGGNGGSSGALTLQTGNGGNGGNAGNAGTGGSGAAAGTFTLQGGNGGSGGTTVGGAGAAGGAGSNIVINGGNGGNGRNAAGINPVNGGSGGNGANITLNPGIGGSGGNGAGGGSNGATGSTGNIILANLRGNVGIGTSAPSSLLFVQGTSTAPTSTLLTVASSTGSTLLTVLATGNVGIGTASPASLLQVAGDIRLGVASTTAGQIILQNASNGYTTTLKSSSSQASNLTFTLPNTAGSAGQALLTDSAGGLYFGTVASSGGSATTTINGVNGPAFTFATGTSGSNFNIATSSGTVTFNIPYAASNATGLLQAADWSAFNSKLAYLTINGATSTNYTFNIGTAGASPAWATSTNTITLNLPIASASATGTLSAADWSAFNGKGSSNLAASGTAGNIQFYGSSSALNANALFTWDNTNQRLGIGTSAPATTLSLQGTSGTDLLNISSSSGQSLLYVAQNGNVGIGTASPGYKLEVNNSIGLTSIGSLTSATSGEFTIAANPDLNTTIKGGSSSFDGATGGFLTLDSGVAYYPGGSVTLSSGNLAPIYNPPSTLPSSIVITGPNYDTGGNITLSAKGSYAAGGGYIALNVGAAGTEAMRVISSGNVGIGTSSATSRLAIKAATSDSTAHALTITDSNNNILLDITNGGVTYPVSFAQGAYFGGNSAINGTLAAVRFGDYSNGAYYLAPSNATQSLTVAGNVGIGTSSPSQLLTVGNNNQFTVSSAGALAAQSATIGTANANLALGKIYTTSPAPDHSISATALTNGSVRDDTYSGQEFSVAWNNNDGTVVVDLGSSVPVSQTKEYMSGGGAGGIVMPSSINISLSTDNVNFTSVATSTGMSDAEQWITQTFSPVAARYVKYTLTHVSSDWVALGEVQTFGPSSQLVVDSSGDMTTGGTLSLTGIGYNYFAGNVGIGTTSPAQLLSVAGNMQLTGALFDANNASGTLGMVLQTTGTGTKWVATSTLGISAGASASGTPGNIQFAGAGNTLNANSLFTWDNTLDRLALGTTSTSSTFTLQGQSGSAPLLTISSSTGSTLMTVLANGNVGIGTSSSAATLTVNGTTQLLSTLNLSIPGSTPVVVGTPSWTTKSPSYSFSPASGDLVSGLLDDGGLSNSVNLTDGSIGTYGSSAGSTQISNNTTVTYTLGNGAHGTGYNITTINIYSGWSDGGRSDITVSDFTYSTPSNPGVFTDIPSTSVNYSCGSAQCFAQLTASGGDIAINVYAIKFNFGTQENGFVGYKELEVVGSSAAPSSDIGSAASPALSFGPAGNSGLFFTTNNVLGFSISGTEKMRIDGSGNVGIGTSGPSTTLNIQGSSGTNPFLISSSTGSSLMVLDQTGSLTLAGALTVSSATTTINGLSYYWPTTINSGDKYLHVDSGGNLTWAAVSGLTASGTAGNIQFYGTSGALNANSLFTWDNTLDRLALGTTSTSSTFTLQGQSGSAPLLTISSSTGSALLTVLANGNVGIGSSTPTALTTIQGSSGSTTDLLNVASSTNSSLFIVKSTGNVGIGSSTPVATLTLQGTSGTNPLYIASSTGAGLMVIRQNGNIGIGTSAPVTTLSLQGTSGTDLLNISSSTGTSVLYISQNSNIGVGTTTPAARFALQGSAGSTTQLFDISSSTGISLFHVSSAGNIGIGTSTASSLLTLQGSNTNVNNLLTIASSSGATLLSVGWYGEISQNISSSTAVNVQNGSGSSVFAIDTTQSSTNAGMDITAGASQTGNLLGIYSSGGTLMGGFAGDASLFMKVASTTALNVQDQSGNNVFNVDTITKAVGINTTTAATLFNLQQIGSSELMDVSNNSGTSLFHISSAGNIGIGTSTPGYPLDIQNATGQARIQSTTGTNLADLLFSNTGGTFYVGRESNTSGGILAGDTAYAAVLTLGNYPMQFGTNSVLRMTIASGGNVGIGTTSPAAILSVMSTAGSGSPLFMVASSTAYSGTTTLFYVAQSGNVGIGTSAPTASLYIQVNGATDPFIIASSTASTSTYFSVKASGNVGVGTSTPGSRFVVAANCSSFAGNPGNCTDYAEIYPSQDAMAVAELVSSVGTDDLSGNMVRKTTAAYDSRLLGVVSSNPAMVIEGNSVQFMSGASYEVNPLRPAVALAGRVPVKIATDTVIHAGDFLTSSNVPGVAMKATRSGQVIGQALEDFDPATNNSPNPAILVFVNPGFQMINNAFVLEDGGGQTTGQVGAGAPSSTVTSFLINQQGNGNLLQLQVSGADRLLVQNDGSINILASTTIATSSILSVQNGTTTQFSITAAGHITVGQDTAGTAIIGAGQNQATVTFAVPYDTLPKIAVTVQGLPNFFYGVATKTPEGFVIQASQPVASDTSFDWIALAQPATSTSQSSLNTQIVVVSQPSGQQQITSGGSSGGGDSTSASTDTSATSTDASTASTTPPSTDQGQVAGTSTTTIINTPAAPPDTTNTTDTANAPDTTPPANTNQ